MIRDEIKLPYKLEQHLGEICKSNAAYEDLLSVWNINKKMCQDILSTIVMNYPHYTKHDISHSEAIITNIEMLLGEEAIRSLSPTDTWLLLHAAYFHDLGMVLENKRIEKNWESKEFQDYIRELENSDDSALAQNAKFINSLGEQLGKKENIAAWPVRVKYAVTLIIANYYRGQHATDSNDYIKEMGSAFHIDLGFNGLIPQRLIILLGEIACMHTESNKRVLELDYRTNGFNSDYAHPRFLAQMLRMGDLLDADSNRFNATNENVFGSIPESSKNHWEKHTSTRHILITPDVIEYRADCNKTEVYRETRIFLSWLKEEVEFWALNWKNIMPDNINGSAPKLGMGELLLNGVPDIQGLSDLKFAISPEKAFEVIEGASIYEDQFVFLREVIQNALDACKIQMWRDISQNRYESWIHRKSETKIDPFEIDPGVFKNYKIEVKLCNQDDNHIKIIIKDNGIGISVKQLKQICDVGVSYCGDKKRKEEIESMPLWLQPTAGFGIGLQSIFLVADEFEIYSKSSVEDGIHARVTSRRKNGYVQISKSEKLKFSGTEIHIVISRDILFKFSLVGRTFEYIEEKYDPFAAEKNILYYKIWDVLRDNVESTYFPIELFFDNELVHTITPQCFNELRDDDLKKRYRYVLNDDYCMELWDSETCTWMKIRLGEKYSEYNNLHYFKGMEIQNDPKFNFKGIQYQADFYGLNTKQSLTLDRKKLKKAVWEDIKEILNSAIEFFMPKIQDRLFSDTENIGNDKLNYIYTYWCILPLKEKKDLLENHVAIFEKIPVMVDVFIKSEDNNFEKKEIHFEEILKELENIATIENISTYIKYEGVRDVIKETELMNILKDREIPFSIIIIDRKFSEVIKPTGYDKIMIIAKENNSLILTSHTKLEKKLPSMVDDETKKSLLHTLLEKSDPVRYYRGLRDSIRRYIGAVVEYRKVCTSQVPFGVSGRHYNSVGYIISPVTTKQWEKSKHLEVDEFIGNVCASVEFGNLVEHVYQHQINQTNFSKDEIESEYKKLLREIYENEAR